MWSVFLCTQICLPCNLRVCLAGTLTSFVIDTFHSAVVIYCRVSLWAIKITLVSDPGKWELLSMLGSARDSEQFGDLNFKFGNYYMPRAYCNPKLSNSSGYSQKKYETDKRKDLIRLIKSDGTLVWMRYLCGL